MIPVVYESVPVVSATPPVGLANQSIVVTSGGDTVPKFVNDPGPVLAAPVADTMVGSAFTVPDTIREIVGNGAETKLMLPVKLPVLPAAILIYTFPPLVGSVIVVPYPEPGKVEISKPAGAVTKIFCVKSSPDTVTN